MANAKHWSAEMFVLCWTDEKNGGRMRMSWHRKREKLEQLVAETDGCSDPVLYDGFGSRLTVRPSQASVTVVTKKPAKKKAKKKPAPVAVAA